MDSPIDEGLSSAFGDDGSSFAETMTGIISTVTEKFKGRDDAAPEAPAAEPATSALTSGSGGSAAKGKIIGIVAAAIVVAAVATAWFMRGDEEPAQPVEQVSTSTPTVTED